ncbi:MAG: Helix-turn-helix domain [Flaviaesturariibacter sp.]|nr:Helix-turn-helix domain [Flaviaesturariibacter sp.]
MMTTGEKIAGLRSLKGYTQEEMAAALNKAYGQTFLQPVTRDALAQWERDYRHFDWAVGKAYSQFFGVSLDDLIFEDRKLQQLAPRKSSRKAVSA